MVDVFKYQMNSFLLSEYLDKVYEVRMFQHLQHQFTTVNRPISPQYMFGLLLKAANVPCEGRE